MDTFEKRFQRLMGKKSQVEFANELGVTKQKIHNYIKGIVKPTYDVFCALSSKGYDVDWLLSGRRSCNINPAHTVNEQEVAYGDGIKRIPLYDEYESGLDITQWGSYRRKLYTIYVDKYYENPFCIKVNDDYLDPEIILGDVLLCSEDDVNIKSNNIIFVLAVDDVGPRYANKKDGVIITSHNKNKAIKVYKDDEYKNIKIYKINKLIRDWS